MSFIGVDIGSSSIKGAVLDLERLEIGRTARVSCPPAIAGLPPRHFELDPMAVVVAVRTVLDELLSTIDDCEGIVSCCQMSGVILAGTDGRPLTNYLSWRDQRVLEKHPTGDGSYFDALQKRIGDEGRQQLGHECKLGSAPSLLYWLAEQQRLPRGATPLMLGDYVWSQLCDAEPVTEYTNALGAINLETRDWHRAVLEKLHLAELSWPRLCTPYQPAGMLRHGGRDIPCYPAVGDHQCAVAGTMLENGELSINVSTGSQISLLAAEYAPGDYQVRPYFDGQYLHTLTHLPAGRSLNVLVDLLSELAKSQHVALDDHWAYIARAAAETDTDLAVDLAFFAGPMGERGSIHNISVDNLSVGSLFRAAFQNMADNFAACARRLSPNKNWQGLVLSGGLVQQCDILRELILQQITASYRMCAAAEETFVGLLALSLVASGRVTTLADALHLLRS